MAGLFEELKRRNVIRVGIAYVVAAWLVLQFSDLVLENIGAPAWVIQSIMLVLAIGLPITLIIAWAFELTPDGLKLESEVDRSQTITPQTGRKLDRIIIGVLAAAVILLVVDRFIIGGPSAETSLASVDKSIAVLPFADLSQNQDQEWFADGLAEEILNALARAPDLLVSSRTSSFAYKGTDKDLPTIAAEIGVAHILEGSVRRAGERLRVTAQLIRASDGFHLWSQNYDRDEDDVIGIQEDLAVQIATALQTTMDPDALKDMVRVGTNSVEAYQLYVRGTSIRDDVLRTEPGPTAALRALTYFEQARAIDPGFSAAHRRAAEFWLVQLSPSLMASGATDQQSDEMLENFRERIDLAIQTATNDVDRTQIRAIKASADLRLTDASGLWREYLAERPNDFDAWRSLLDTVSRASDQEAIHAVLDHLKTAGKTNVRAAGTFINFAYRWIDPDIAADYGLDTLNRWPEARNLMYQVHRTLLWAMRIDEAARIASSFDGSDVNYRVVAARQACAEGNRDVALKFLAERRAAGIAKDNIDWLLYKILAAEDEATEVVRLYDAERVPTLVGSWLTYHKFDPGPHPYLMSILEREGIDRPPAATIPFACPAN
jgi:TolB-like protein